MESTNLNEEEYHHHHHHHQEVEDHHEHGVVSSHDSSMASPCFSLGTHHHAWRSPSSNFILNGNNIHGTCGEEEEETSNSLTNSMIQNMGFAWANPNHDDNQESLISNKIIKQESSSTSLNHHVSDELLLLNTLSPNMLQLSGLPHRHGRNTGVTNTNFSQIFPTVNISKLSNINNTTMVMSHGLQDTMDVFPTINAQEVAPSNSHLLQLFKLDHHHHLRPQSSDLKLWNEAYNLSTFDNNDLKRPSFVVDPKSTQHLQMLPKKPRFESPPFKVRKEKLGDRIGALQQLVAPFGKTDTASVLMEAIGYIKFLQNQIETLSVPYTKLSSRSQIRANNNQRVSEKHGDEGEKHKSELRSRGLCLVPLSCMTYIANDACNGGVWPSPNFHPGF